MDKAAIKALLESYQSKEANDPLFVEALQQAATDPGLSAWFEEVQKFDAVVTKELRSIPVPPNVKRYIISGYRPESYVKTALPFRQWLVPTSIAAVLALTLFAWKGLSSRASDIYPLESEAIAYTKEMPRLQFVCFDPAAVARWINEQPGAREMGLRLPLPKSSMAMVMIGSSVTKWNGHPVVMICLQDEKRMAMLYILSGDVAPQITDGTTETIRKADWVVRATKTDGQLHLLATRGGPEDLDFPMPF